ncbi:hypothetical protein, partial [Arthrobacter sp. W4I7]|uniref:hypothetical protein n=1 Tax=Arthrobacter sp. W4I7 TaxID=3042296 RepID=UPI00277FD245
FQTYPTRTSFANQRFRDYQHRTISPTRTGTPKSEPFSRPFEEGGWPQTFRISGGDSENNTRPHTNPQIHPHTPQNPQKPRNFRGAQRTERRQPPDKAPYVLAHIRAASANAPKAPA